MEEKEKKEWKKPEVVDLDGDNTLSGGVGGPTDGSGTFGTPYWSPSYS